MNTTAPTLVSVVEPITTELCEQAADVSTSEELHEFLKTKLVEAFTKFATAIAERIDFSTKTKVCKKPGCGKPVTTPKRQMCDEHMTVKKPNTNVCKEAGCTNITMSLKHQKCKVHHKPKSKSSRPSVEVVESETLDEKAEEPKKVKETPKKTAKFLVKKFGAELADTPVKKIQESAEGLDDLLQYARAMIAHEAELNESEIDNDAEDETFGGIAFHHLMALCPCESVKEFNEKFRWKSDEEVSKQRTKFYMTLLNTIAELNDQEE